MPLETLKNILEQFDVAFTPPISLEPINTGHINDTYRVITGNNARKYLLQRKNHKVFKDVPGMMENIHRVTQHLKTKQKNNPELTIGTTTIDPIPSKENKDFFTQVDGNFYTLTHFIQNAHNYETITTDSLAIWAGRVFGSFIKALSDLPGPSLNITIPHFHDISFRYDNFIEAVSADAQKRMREVMHEIRFFEEKYLHLLDLFMAYEKGHIPPRIIHNDTKINNLLFDARNEVCCILDLDTVMPGAIHFDFGDAIRTGMCTSNEAEKDLRKVTFDMDLFRNFTKGFLEKTKDILLPSEQQYLPIAPFYMTYLMGIRFLTDYLQGDIYYKISQPDENIIRARSQIKLYREMEKQYSGIVETIDRARN